MQARGQLMDGDAGFTAVNDRVHPSQLPAGVVASATNLRFEYGDARPRWAVNGALWGHSSQMGGNPLAACRWYEPESGEEAVVVVTDGVRSDGGRGRVWRVLAGGGVKELDLDGHDVWGTCRLVPARSGLLLLRDGNARTYISTAQVTAGSDKITVNADIFTTGDMVLVKAVSGSLPSPLVDTTRYWVERVSATEISICTSAGAVGPITLVNAPTVQFYVERMAGQPGPGGNGAAVLLLEPAWDAGYGQPASAWDQAFKVCPQSVSGTVANTATLWTAANHRFAAGQRVRVRTTANGFTNSTDYYVDPTDNHHFHLNTSQENALLRSATGRVAATGDNTDSILPYGYALQPIVPLREGVYFKNRLVGLNGRNNVAVSDPGDFLHFTPMEGALTAALGNGDPLTTIIPLGEDTLLLMSESQVLGITGLNSASTNWRLVQVTQEYGCLAPLSAVQVGADVWFLSRAGVISVRQTEFGEQQGVAVPVSQPMSRKFNEIDWRHADQACGAWFGNKYVLAVPMINQTGTVVNNGVFVYNFITQGWDGFWQGDALEPVQFCRLKVGGQERLAFLNSDGSVQYFTEGDLDLTSAGAGENTEAMIVTQLKTRAYTAGSPRAKQWHEAELVVDTLDATWSATAITEGYNQERTYQGQVTKDPTKFFQHGQADFYNSQSERANLPYREDYALVDDTQELIVSNAGVAAVNGTYLPNGTVNGRRAYQNDDYRLEWNTSHPTGWKFISRDDGSIPYRDTEDRATPDLVQSWVAVVGVGALPLPTVEEAGIALPDEGLPLDAHQTYLKRIGLHEQSRSLQVQLDNTTGSARWRSVYVSTVPERGD